MCIFRAILFSSNLQNLFIDSDLDWVPANGVWDGTFHGVSLKGTLRNSTSERWRKQNWAEGEVSVVAKVTSTAPVFLERSLVWRQGCGSCIPTPELVRRNYSGSGCSFETSAAEDLSAGRLSILYLKDSASKYLYCPLRSSCIFL